jgi:DNA-binding transcriptional MocR family regulator
MLTLTAAQAGRAAYKARRLRSQRQITLSQFVLHDCLLWQARKPGQGRLTISLRRLAALSGLTRSTVAAGVQALERLGLIRRIKRRIRVAWALGVASRQAANGYEIVPPDTESDCSDARDKSPDSMPVEQPNAAVKAAEEALARVVLAAEKRLWKKETAHDAAQDRQALCVDRDGG